MLENTKKPIAVMFWRTSAIGLEKRIAISLFVYSFYQSCPHIIRKWGDYIEQSAK